MTRAYILSPRTEQAEGLRRLLARTGAFTLVGVLLPGERKPRGGRFDELLPAEAMPLDAPSLIFPTGMRSTTWLSEQGDYRVGRCQADRTSLALVSDKRAFLQVAVRSGVATPKTWHRVDDIQREDFPIFYKEAFELGGGRRGLAHSRHHLPQELDALIFQEVIESTGTFGVAFLAESGEVLHHHAHHEVLSYPASGGSAACMTDVEDPRLIELTHAMVNNLKYSGWGLAEFKWCTRRNDYVVMEINAKLWASCEHSFARSPEMFHALTGEWLPEDRHPSRVFVHRLLASGPSQAITGLRGAKGAKLTWYGQASTSLLAHAARRYLGRGLRTSLHG